MSPNSRVFMGDGSVKTFEELAQPAFLGEIKKEGDVEYSALDKEILSLEGSRLSARAAKIITRRKAPQEMLRLTTSTGHVLEVTKEHPILSWEKSQRWSEAESLKVGSFIAAPSSSPVAGSRQIVDLAKELKGQKRFYAARATALICDLKVKSGL